jgi:membrane-anchored glycerophosphoryl diester phosphodiesterase (GDPDase)
MTELINSKPMGVWLFIALLLTLLLLALYHFGYVVPMERKRNNRKINTDNWKNLTDYDFNQN